MPNQGNVLRQAASPHNPFASNPRTQQPPAQRYAQPRRQYEPVPNTGDYPRGGSSTTRLAGSPGFYDQNSQFSRIVYQTLLVYHSDLSELCCHS